MQKTILLAIPALFLFAHCGQPASSSTNDHISVPDDIRALASCGSMRNSQKAELCDTMIRHIPICDKTCVNFESEFGGRVTYECTSPSPVEDNGSRCNYRNTWNPGLNF